MMWLSFGPDKEMGTHVLRFFHVDEVVSQQRVQEKFISIPKAT